VELDLYWGEHWDRGISQEAKIPHNLAVWGWDLRDALDWTADKLREYIQRDPHAYWRNINHKSAWRVLAPAHVAGKALTVFEAAAQLGSEGTDRDPRGPGIETLVVELGANNALKTIIDLQVVWSDEGYDRLFDKTDYTVWNPVHFKKELDRVVAEVVKINAQHVIFATVPHVTIAPLARGVDEKVQPKSRYFPFYTRPWVKNFNEQDEKNITAAQARAIDAAIDQYNQAIESAVMEQRKQGKDWYLLELSGLLDRMASRRYLDSPNAQPTWWEAVGGKYELPAALQKLVPPPTSHFFSVGPDGQRDKGGLFSLDGVHPTTIGYGIIAQEVINIMQHAKVPFYWGDDQKVSRELPIEVDFERLIVLDSLISNPPPLLSQLVNLLGLLDQRFDNLLRVFGAHLRWP
jgi:hypothetical protein